MTDAELAARGHGYFTRSEVLDIRDTIHQLCIERDSWEDKFSAIERERAILRQEVDKLRNRVMVCPSCGHETHFKYPEPPSERQIRLVKFINHVMAHHNLPDICCPDIEEKT